MRRPILIIPPILALVAAAAAQPTTTSAPGVDATYDTAETLFADNFVAAGLNPRKWTASQGVEVSDPLRPPAALLVGGVRGRALLRSRTIPLDVGSAVLHFALRASDPEAGPLRVDYRDARGRWRRLAEIAPHEAIGLAGPLAVQQPLPLGALHSDAAIRFRAGEMLGGVWELRAVRVDAFAEQYVLTADVSGPDWAWLGVYDALDDARHDVEAPFAQAYPRGQQVSLLAPAEVDRWRFEHWTVGDRVSSARLLPLEIAEATEVVAHYGTGVAGQPLVPLRIGANVSGIDVAVRLDGGPLLTHASGTYRLQRGERLLLAAPERIGRTVFVGWSDGWPEPARQVTAESAGAFRADYALLGDLNGDGRLDGLDVDAMVQALADPDGFRVRYPQVAVDRVGDLDGDGLLTEGDVDPFVGLFFDD